MANQDIKSYARQKGVKLWQIADVKGVSEPTMTRWLRFELPESEKAEYIHIIDELAGKYNIKKNKGKCGTWEDVVFEHVDELDAYFIEAKCSCCGRYNQRISAYTYDMSNKYCSLCGADMHKEV